jgi:DNA polymerase-3 subunit delta
VEGTSPNVFLLDGEDDFGIMGFVSGLEARLGNPDMASLNTSRLDGRSLNLDELVRACSAMPFLTEMRLVIVSQPATRLTDNTSRERFKSIVSKTPPTTLLALVQSGNLTDERDRKKGKLHWLEGWCVKSGGKLSFKHFTLPHGEEMVKWIQKRVKTAGGQITPGAAARLAELAGDAPRRAEQEILKLLEYVNYARPVDEDDVTFLTPNTAPPADFALTNALRDQKTKQAQIELHKLLDNEDALTIFGKIVAQFRTVIQVREMMDQRITNEDEIARRMGMHPYAAKMVVQHGRRFEMAELEKIFQRLSELDYAIKTGKIEAALALERLVIELTDKSALPSGR